jgi:nucleoside-diphosphate-sugar epimerase
MQKIFITGANGFVGKHLTSELKKRNIDFVPGERALYGDLVTQNSWETILKDCSSIVHLAARVHVMNEKDNDPLKAFKALNVEATLNIAQAAKKLGVKCFIYISSIKVNGEETHGTPYRASDIPNPQDPYGVSKSEAENELMKLHLPGIFEVVIIRPPLVYGPGVKANFEKLFYFVQKDLPIPFKLVKNKRSLVSVFNLVDLIICCLENPKAAGKIFLVSDDQDLSLPELITEMANVSGKFPHLLPVPVGVMKFGAKLLGKSSFADRLFGDLQVDISETKEQLSWKPTYTFQSTFKN